MEYGEKLKRAHDLVTMLNRKSVRGLMKVLSGREMNVTQIYVALRKDQANISYLLGCLREENIVCYRHDGYFTVYSINTARISEINAAIAKI